MYVNQMHFFVDFNECTSGESDCSQWATCTNTWGSFTCVCLEGFIDINSEWPGRACQGRFSELKGVHMQYHSMVSFCI